MQMCLQTEINDHSQHVWVVPTLGGGLAMNREFKAFCSSFAYPPQLPPLPCMHSCIGWLGVRLGQLPAPWDAPISHARGSTVHQSRNPPWVNFFLARAAPPHPRNHYLANSICKRLRKRFSAAWGNERDMSCEPSKIPP